MSADLSAALEEIRETARKRDEALAWVERASADNGELDAAAGAFEAVNDKLAARALRLLAAIEAVLKLTDGWIRKDWPLPPTPREAAAMAIREAISRELTGKGEDGNHG